MSNIGSSETTPLDNSIKLTVADLHKEEGFGTTLLRSIGYSTLQNPVNGLAQLVDRTTGTDLLPKVQFIDSPSKDTLATESASALGGMVGTIIHCGVMVGIGSRIGGSEFSLNGFRNRAIATGAMGAAYGGIFTPVTNEDGNFTRNRLENTVVGAAGLTLMSPLGAFKRMPGEPFRLGKVAVAPLLLISTGMVVEAVSPKNWSKLEWFPSVKEPGAPEHKLTDEELKALRPRAPVFVGPKTSDISELQPKR